MNGTKACSLHTFVETWNAAETARDAASALHLATGTARVKACRLRAQGWPVKLFKDIDTRPKTTAQTFVEIWQSAATLEEAAIRLDAKPKTATIRACRLRRAGHVLKVMPRGFQLTGREFASSLGKMRRLGSEEAKAMRAKVTNMHRLTHEECSLGGQMHGMKRGVLRALGIKEQEL